MKIRLEVSAVEAVMNKGAAHYIRMHGISADAPGRHVVVVSGPYAREKADQIIVEMKKAVPGVTFPEAGVVCEAFGYMVDGERREGEPVNILRINADAPRILHNAELVLYRNYERLVTMINRVRDMPNVPFEVLHEIEEYGKSCGWNAISLESISRENMGIARPFEALPASPHEVKPPEEAAAEKLGIQGAKPEIAAAPPVEESREAAIVVQENAQAKPDAVEPASRVEERPKTLKTILEAAIPEESLQKTRDEKAAAALFETTSAGHAPEADKPSLAQPEPSVTIGTPTSEDPPAPVLVVAAPRPSFGGGSRFGSRPLTTSAVGVANTPDLQQQPAETGEAPETAKSHVGDEASQMFADCLDSIAANPQTEASHVDHESASAPAIQKAASPAIKMNVVPKTTLGGFKRVQPVMR